MKKLLLFFSLFAAAPVAAQTVWTPDLGNGKYKNPVLYADYSDPDVVRTGDDYWMTSSSFNCVPGLQILHSTDLVNWEIVKIGRASCRRGSGRPPSASTTAGIISIGAIPTSAST